MQCLYRWRERVRASAVGTPPPSPPSPAAAGEGRVIRSRRTFSLAPRVMCGEPNLGAGHTLIRSTLCRMPNRADHARLRLLRGRVVLGRGAMGMVTWPRRESDARWQKTVHVERVRRRHEATSFMSLHRGRAVRRATLRTSSPYSRVRERVIAWRPPGRSAGLSRAIDEETEAAGARRGLRIGEGAPRSTTHTPKESFTATSSRRTSFSPPTAKRKSPTSASPVRPIRISLPLEKCSGRRATCPRNR